MEIHYQNVQADIRAYSESLWRQKKTAQRNNYYLGLFWYLAVLGLASFIAISHEEVFATCVFAILAVFYVTQNWSFAQHWRAQIESYTDMIPESSCTLLLDEKGLRERCSGIELLVPWSEIQNYSITEERLFINFTKYRSFLIPFRHLSNNQLDELIEMLKQHSIRKIS